METITIETQPTGDDETVHDAVVAAVEEVEHRHEVEEQLDRIEDAQGDAWQAIQMEQTNLSNRIAALETTLLGLAIRTEEAVEVAEDARDEAQEAASVSSTEDLGTPSSDEIVLTPPETEPEPEPAKRGGFSPLRNVLKPKSR